MALGILVGAWLAGTLGGIHCLTMCGAFTAAVSARAREGAATPLVPLRTLVLHQLGYHAGRVATYTALGAAFGAGGAAALEANSLLPLQRALYVLANVVLLALAARMVLTVRHAGWLQRAGAQTFGSVLPVVEPLLRQPGLRGRVALGLVWGLVPCALVYSVLPVALFAGGWWQGAAVMLAFGLGTVPNLTGAGLLVGRGTAFFERRTLRLGVAALLVVYAAVGIYRVLFVPEAMASGPFCLLH